MKKISFLFYSLCLISFASFAQDTKKSKVETANSNEADIFNKKMKDITIIIENTDLKDLNELIQKSATFLEQNVDSVISIVNKIDFTELNKSAEVLAKKIETSIDVDKLEEKIDHVIQKIEKIEIKK